MGLDVHRVINLAISRAHDVLVTFEFSVTLQQHIFCRCMYLYRLEFIFSSYSLFEKQILKIAK